MFPLCRGSTIVTGYGPLLQIISFIVGFVNQSLWTTFVVLGGGTAVVALVCICIRIIGNCPLTAVWYPTYLADHPCMAYL